MSISIPFDVLAVCACHQPVNANRGGTVTTTAAKPPKGQKISWERVWTTKPANSILRPFCFGTGCFGGVAGFKWEGSSLRGGVRPILAADLMAYEPHNYEVD